MRLLVLGGTWFLGRALVEEALQLGHEVTTFNRGRTARDVPGIKAVVGDRSSQTDLEVLACLGPWDAVVDTSGMVPRDVLASARALRPRAGRYAFVSTVNAYQGWPFEPLTEASAVRECAADASGIPASPDEDAGDRYGRLKAGCERAVMGVYGQKALVLRPGVIVGPHEYIGRLPWWLRRLRRGGKVLAPGDPDRQIQPVDARDVAGFTLMALAAGRSGTFNVTAPFGHSTFGELLNACRRTTGGSAELVWVEDNFVLNRGVRMWTELPLWRTYPGTWRIDGGRARDAGLTCRPLTQTVTDTWAWLAAGGSVVDSPRAAEIGIDPVKEAALLAAWAAHRVGKWPCRGEASGPPGEA
ncbi:MAG: NAD-dependent epimerase/dehydratase family protein [Egibacteraceae bacterium]